MHKDVDVPLLLGKRHNRTRVDFEPVTGLVAKYVDGCDTESEAKQVLLEITKRIPNIDLKLLRTCYNWLGKLREGYHVASLCRLYELSCENPDLSMGPTSFRFCSTISEVEQQIKIHRAVLGDAARMWSLGKEAVVRERDGYAITLGAHTCEFGTGLIVFRMYHHQTFLYQVSMYPSPMPVIFEIKGARGGGDRDNARRIKSGVHRFNSQFDHSVALELVLTAINRLPSQIQSFRLSVTTPLWRNYGIQNNPERLAQADKQYRRVYDELDGIGISVVGSGEFSASDRPKISHVVALFPSPNAYEFGGVTLSAYTTPALPNLVILRRELNARLNNALSLGNRYLKLVTGDEVPPEEAVTVDVKEIRNGFQEALSLVRGITQSIFYNAFPCYNDIANATERLCEFFEPIYALEEQLRLHDTSAENVRSSAALLTFRAKLECFCEFAERILRMNCEFGSDGMVAVEQIFDHSPDGAESTDASGTFRSI